MLLCPFCADDLGQKKPKPPPGKQYIYILNICGNTPKTNNYVKFKCDYCHQPWFIEIQDEEIK